MLFKSHSNILVSFLVVIVICTSSFGSEGDDDFTELKESLIHETLKAPALVPNKEWIASLESKLPGSLSVLQYTISHMNANVRVNTAYVIDQLGKKATSLIPDLLRAMRDEKDQMAKIYIAMALSTVGVDNPEVATGLRKAFSGESDPKAKTYLAGAIVIVSSPSNEKDAWEWLLESLRRPTRKSKSLLDQPWDRPWGAAEMLGRLGGKAKPALEKIESLATESTTPNWVKTKLIDTQAIILNELKKRSMCSSR